MQLIKFKNYFKMMFHATELILNLLEKIFFLTVIDSLLDWFFMFAIMFPMIISCYQHLQVFPSIQEFSS